MEPEVGTSGSMTWIVRPTVSYQPDQLMLAALVTAVPGRHEDRSRHPAGVVQNAVIFKPPRYVADLECVTVRARLLRIHKARAKYLVTR